MFILCLDGPRIRSKTTIDDDSRFSHEERRLLFPIHPVGLIISLWVYNYMIQSMFL